MQQADWLRAISTWSPLRIAAGCRLHKEATRLIQEGRIDPDDPATTSVQDILDVLSTSNADPDLDELPWQNAPPICKATCKLVADATRGWHRTTNWLHHRGVKEVVYAVLFVVVRLEKKANESLPDVTESEGGPRDGCGGGGGGGGGGVETIDEGGVATGNEAISAGESSSSSSASAGTSAGARVDDANDDGDGDGGAGDGDGGTTPTTSTSKPLPPGGAGEGKAPPPPVAAKKPKMGPPPVVARAASAAADGDGDAPAPAKPGEKIRSF